MVLMLPTSPETSPLTNGTSSELLAVTRMYTSGETFSVGTIAAEVAVVMAVEVAVDVEAVGNKVAGLTMPPQMNGTLRRRPQPTLWNTTLATRPSRLSPRVHPVTEADALVGDSDQDVLIDWQPQRQLQLWRWGIQMCPPFPPLTAAEPLRQSRPLMA